MPVSVCLSLLCLFVSLCVSLCLCLCSFWDCIGKCFLRSMLPKSLLSVSHWMILCLCVEGLLLEADRSPTGDQATRWSLECHLISQPVHVWKTSLVMPMRTATRPLFRSAVRRRQSPNGSPIQARRQRSLGRQRIGFCSHVKTATIRLYRFTFYWRVDWTCQSA